MADFLRRRRAARRELRNGTRGRVDGPRGVRGRERGRCPRLRHQEWRYGSCCGLLFPEAAFVAGEKAADVFVMLHDDEDRDEQEACNDDGGSLPHEVEGEKREARGGDDGGERNVSSDEKDDQKDGEGAGSCRRREREEDTEGAGHAFAATKAEPDGEDVSKDCSYGCYYGEIEVIRSEVLGDFDSEVGFAAVEEKSEDAEAFGS